MKWSVISSPALLILYLVTFSSAEELKRKTPVHLKIQFTSILDTPPFDCASHRLCPDNLECSIFDTCCQRWPPWRYSCCPLPNAVCCYDLKHCCPEGYICSPIVKGCIPEHKSQL
ncbi:hypothetical protein pdam_00020130 [Pocillopora damicornis]|uniref:Granulins domain-containing protein n=2 Tax=Pocillopora damicornis TaxID=46731 RepID=A0A3M6UBR2_POCDA|nr:hypothetical protein pdam_00020130 [Pocillopora damicornis]